MLFLYYVQQLGPRHHIMARHSGCGERNDLLIWTLYVNVLNKCSRMLTRCRPPACWLVEVITPHPKDFQCYETLHEASDFQCVEENIWA